MFPSHNILSVREVIVICDNIGQDWIQKCWQSSNLKNMATNTYGYCNRHVFHQKSFIFFIQNETNNVFQILIKHFLSITNVRHHSAYCAEIDFFAWLIKFQFSIESDEWTRNMYTKFGQNENSSYDKMCVCAVCINCWLLISLSGA